ncbi:MAG: transcriptional regulator [Candidatus Pacearchaeota archaeon]
MYSLPQEIEVWYIIPAIRRELARVLVEKHKLKQKEVANILGTTESAVSQYLSKKRAIELKFPLKMKKEFENAAGVIVKDNKKVIQEILHLLNIIKQQGLACCICKKYNKGILALCSARPLMETR